MSAPAPLPIADIAARLGIPADALIPFGHTKAKLDRAFLADIESRPAGRLVLVTAISPTPAGEGKTTVAIGLADGMNRIGSRTVLALREPSLGPCFGMKGGATGGGLAQVVPTDEINLHFTGDFHAITTANNLLAALVDNHLHWGNVLGLDPQRITWRRALDMNDRALREVRLGMGPQVNGPVRDGGFDITPASEVMAVLCLARDAQDLAQRLGRMIVGYRADGAPVFARELDAAGAMSVLLKDALLPNLVQTREHTPALVHGGPFANIAHGCNSLIATRAAQRLADFTVTEAGFGADLGAEKFFDIAARVGGLRPDVAVMVATVRALKMHGGVAKDRLDVENIVALRDGGANLARHVRNMARFGVPVVVAINRFASDTDAEVRALADLVTELGCAVAECTPFRDGGAGAERLARLVTQAAQSGVAAYRPLYAESLPLWDKVDCIAREIYGADGVVADAAVRARFAEIDATAPGALACIAKTQYSFSSDPSLLGAPVGHALAVRDVLLANGAGFAVVVCGDIMRMPGLPRRPAAEHIRLEADGRITGLS